MSRRTIGRRNACGFFPLLGLVLCAVASSAAPAAASDWKWSITPYLWASDLGADIAVNDQQVASTDISFGDLLDKTDLAAMIHFDGQKGRHGFMSDLYFANLEDDGAFALPNPPGGQATASGSFDLTIFEAAGIYNPHGDGEGVALLYGVRVLDRSADIDAVFPGPAGTRNYGVDETDVDAMVGVRYVGRFTPHFSYHLRGDVSAGGTNLTWSAAALLGWSFGDSGRYTLLAGYRSIDFDFDAKQNVATVSVDASLSGPIVGFRFSF